MIGATIAVYFVIVVALGWAASRKAGMGTEDFFLAGRSFGPIVLFVALFGSNVTAFGILGFPGMACREGVGVFGFFGAAAAFFTPLCFILIGYPIWLLGKRHGYTTQAEMFTDRWQSRPIGLLVLGLLVLYTFPYLAVGLIGGGRALERIADIPYVGAALLLTGGAVLYTSIGGMRGTAWTNVFQASLFLVVLIVTLFALADALGGVTTLHQRIVEEKPELLQRKSTGLLSPGSWAAGFLVGPMSVIAFPHIFMRLLAARDLRAMRTSIRWYPWAFLLLFVPGTFIGLWGAVELGATGKEADYVLPTLAANLFPTWLTAIVLAAILAAVMSSLDAQLLSIATMLVIDLGGSDRQRNMALAGRVGVVVIALAALGFALWQPDTIFGIAKFSFSGFTLMVPIFLAAFFWKRSTATGVLAGCIAGNLLLVLYHAKLLGLGLDMSGFTFGTLPVVWCLLVEIVVMVAVSLATAPPPQTVLAKFDDPFGRPA
ncbi:MAG: sodium:solute symporter family protein [Acidobacteriota bacterium]